MSRREFSTWVKAHAALRANGHCELCPAKTGVGNIFYDHRISDALGGEPTLENCQVLCKTCHDIKTRTQDVPKIAKTKRQRAKHLGIRKRQSRPLPGTKASGIRKRMDGRVERW